MVISTLNRKLIRDLKHLITPIISIGLIVAMGLGTFFGFTSTYYSLQLARDRFYQSHNFPDLFATVKKAPRSILESLTQLEGVQAIEGSLLQEGLMTLPQFDEPVIGRFISIPDGEQPVFSRIYLYSGRLPHPFSPQEVVINQAFAEAHGLKLGDTFQATLNGRKYPFVISGIGVSPEYIFALHPANPIPDDLHFGVIWMNQSALASAYDMKASFNQLAFRLGDSASSKEVKDKLDVILEKYGALGAIEKEDQVSNRYISEEIKQLRVQATSVPLIFFIVAAFILNVVLSRLVSTQRSEIAALKALGFTDSEISAYYFKLAGAIILVGVVAGLLLGIWIGQSMTDLYARFYRFPTLVYAYSYGHFFNAVLISIVTAGLGVLSSTRHIFKLSPAQAMRPPTPIEYHKGWIEQRAFFKGLKVNLKMAVRGLSSHPLRSLMSGFGISLAMLLLISGLFWNDSMKLLLNAQYRFIQRESGTLTLSRSLNRSAVWEVEQIYGIYMAEGYRQLPVKARYGPATETTLIFALPDKPRLRGLIDEDLKAIPIASDSVYITQGLARILSLERGDVFSVEVLEGTRKRMQLQVHGIIDSFMGHQILLSRAYLSELLGEEDLVNQIAFRSNPLLTSQIYAELKERPNVVGVSFKSAALKIFEETSARFILVFAFILALFAGAIGFGITYNNARITFAERDWELATLEILGFKNFEVFKILYSEILILTLSFIPLGGLLGYVYSQYLVHQMMPENFNLPFRVAPSTFAYAVLTLLIATALSGIFLYKRIKELDIVETLKTRG